MKKILCCFIVLSMLSLQCMVFADTLLPYEKSFHQVIGVDDINEIKYGVIVDNIDKRCADIDYEDLRDWLEVYWNFKYDRIVAPLEAFDVSSSYIKLWNEDRSKSYTVYSNSGVVVGQYGELKQNYIWYLPVMSNSRSALNSADGTLKHIYLYKTYEDYKDREREITPADEIEVPTENLLVTDGVSQWAKPEIEKAAASNLMVYDLSEKYVQPISRYEFCRLAYRLIATEFQPNTDSRLGIEFAIKDIMTDKGIIDTNTNKFSDCYYKEVEDLASMGIIQGMGDGTFAPDANITREQAATILYRMAEFLGNKTIIKPSYDKMYDDENDISQWAISSVASMKAMGIMQGVSESEFAPQEQYTVEQAIATMLRLYEYSASQEKISLSQFIEEEKEQVISVQIYTKANNYEVDINKFYEIADACVLTKSTEPQTISNDGLYIGVVTKEYAVNVYVSTGGGIDRAVPAPGRPLKALYTMDDVSFVDKLMELLPEIS